MPESKSNPAAVQPTTGVPTLMGIEHIGVAVPDLEAAIEWFSTVIGCEYVYRHGPYEFPEGTPDADNYFVRCLAADPRLRLELATMRCGNGANLELVEVAGGASEHTMTRFPAMGVSHINFYVADMEAAVTHLHSCGVEVLGGIEDSGGAEAGDGSTNVHFLTPWGLMLEFTSYPNGRRYEADTQLRTWQPNNPGSWRDLS